MTNINIHTSTAIRGSHALAKAWECEFASDAQSARLNALCIGANFYPNQVPALYAWADALQRRIETQLDDRHSIGARVIQSELLEELVTDDVMFCDCVAGLAGLIKTPHGNYATPDSVRTHEDIDIEDVFMSARVVTLKRNVA